jgi:Flp pilus assembly protein TadG
MNSSRNHKKKKKRRGAAMVEMAVCFPIFMLMLLGIIEFGRALMVSQLLTAAAREGCREAILDGVTDTAVEADIKAQVVNSVGCLAQNVTVSIVVTDVADGSTLTGLSAAEKRDLINIDITVPFNAISFTSGRFLNGQDLRGQCAMRKE